jgi:hypothetical protein
MTLSWLRARDSELPIDLLLLSDRVQIRDSKLSPDSNIGVGDGVQEFGFDRMPT